MRRETNRWKTRKARKQTLCGRGSSGPPTRTSQGQVVQTDMPDIGIYATAMMLVNSMIGRGRR